ncbi:MAG TPA: FAD-dependent thymidylate synthase [Candidatus Paceibacterota bacterium]|nr:FAD-dependent thymidylate synthase [Candidatus Paceibacterota bacterium]
MLQALHSRSIGGLMHHLGVLAKKGAKNFMEAFYVGYGHKSIGDCGDATVFVEGVSMLVAKAIQDWRLYCGQEASTRYIDFANQRFLNPLGTPEGERILENWRRFYLKGLGILKHELSFMFPRGETDDEKSYQKAINARAFDIMRGFLPAGATTNLAWHANLRQLGDQLDLLRHHPLEEVRDVAEAVESALSEKFPGSFPRKRYPASEAYNKQIMHDFTYFAPDYVDWFRTKDVSINEPLLRKYRTALEDRPPKTELPRKIAECGTLQFEFLLDFASFRDIQRHRAIIQQMPLLTTNFEFHPWYLSQLPEMLRVEAEGVLATQELGIASLGASPEISQYYTAMGFQIPNKLTGDIHALTYLVERRAGNDVHPTLRERAFQIAKALQRELGDYGLILHLDDEPHRFDIKRGTQDIVLK